MAKVYRDLEIQTFLDSKLIRSTFSERPLGLLEIGARWGIDELFHPFSSIISAVAVEPDEEEADRIREKPLASWRKFTVLQEALGKARERRILHLTERPNNSSILDINEHYIERYPFPGFELEQEIALELSSIDELLPMLPDRTGEIVKMDVQGLEKDVLMGAERCLKHNTVAVFCEVSFFSLYKNMPLFGDLADFLANYGFAFYGFENVQQRSAKLLDKSVTVGKERLMQADAVFFKDPLEPHAQSLDERQIASLVTAATIFGYFDFAIELSRAYLDIDILNEIEPVIVSIARKKAEIATKNFREQLRGLDSSSANHVTLGRWIDRNRDIHTFWDLPER